MILLRHRAYLIFVPFYFTHIYNVDSDIIKKHFQLGKKIKGGKILPKLYSKRTRKERDYKNSMV